MSARALRHAGGRRGGDAEVAGRESQEGAGRRVQTLSLRNCNLLHCGAELVELLTEVVDACGSGCGNGGGLEELDVRGNGLNADVAQALFALANTRTSLAVINGVCLCTRCFATCETREEQNFVHGTEGLVMGDIRGDRNWTGLEAALLQLSLGNGKPWCLGVRCCVLDENRGLGPQSVAAACMALQVCSNLQALCLSRCGAGAQGATAVANCLSHWPKLTKLEFGGNSAGNRGCKEVLLALAGGGGGGAGNGHRQRVGPLIQQLDLSSNGIGRWSAEEASGEEVNSWWWQWGMLGDRGRGGIGRVGRDGNGSNEDGNVEEAMAVLAQSLRYMDFSGNPLGSAAVGIVRGLSVGSTAVGRGSAVGAQDSPIPLGNTNLHLDLSSCMIGPYATAGAIAEFEEEGRGDEDARGALAPRNADEVHWSVEALAQAVASLAKVRRLDLELRENGLGDQAARHFASIFAAGMDMEHAQKPSEWDTLLAQTAGYALGARQQGLQGLGFAANCVSSDGLMAFADALKRCSVHEHGSQPSRKVERVCRGGGGSDDGCVALRRLDVRENELGAKVAIALKKALEEGGRVLTRLNALELHQWTPGSALSFENLVEYAAYEAPFLSSILSRAGCARGGGTLTSLSLRGCSLRVEGLACVAPAMATLTLLTALDIGRNQLSPDAAQHLILPLRNLSQLQRLSLDYNDLKASGAKTLTKVWAMGLHTSLRSLDIGGNALGTEGLIYFLPAVDITSSAPRRASKAHGAACIARESPLTHLGLESNGLTFSSMETLASVLSSLGRLEVLALGGNRLLLDARTPAASAGDQDSINKLATALATHCHALRYLNFAVSPSVASTKRAAFPAHPSGVTTAGGDRLWWNFGCGAGSSVDDHRVLAQQDGRGPSFWSHDGSLTLGVCLWATEVLEQWRSLHLGADGAMAEELSEWRQEAVRVLQWLLARRSVARAALMGVVAESKLGKALSRTAALGSRYAQGGGTVSVVPVLAAVLKGKWEVLLEGGQSRRASAVD
jgi:hypothetical protein